MDPRVRGTTFVEILRWRSEHHPDRVAFTRWSDEVRGERHVTYGELDSEARAVAASLQERGLAGERVILLSSPGLEYVSAFLGCLYAGVTPVPYYPPAGLARDSSKAGVAARHARAVAKLQSIAATAGIAAVLTHGLEGTLEWPALSAATARPLEGLRLRDLRVGDPDRWRPVAPDPESLAFLQFTSGSTGAPRGVMVTHANLIHNSVLIKEAFGHTEGSLVGVIWLPPYHDMGLIGGILQPIFCGGRCVLMAPAEFLQRPRRWLEAIARHKGTTSGGPNFAYDLAVRRIPPDERNDLDLSSWTVAFSGAEPVRADTIERFSEAFAPCRFDPHSFHPCYGLAEGTLAVSGGRRPTGPHLTSVDRAALAHNEAVDALRGGAGSTTLVACGGALGDQQLAIVDPATLNELPVRRVGEVWVRGPSIARGYWNDAAATTATFGGIRSDGAGPFLRTGDLGYLDEQGQLFIVGRCKDVIIIRGTNHHPADLEQTVESSHMVIRSGGCAAFGVASDSGEHLVVIAELNPRSGESRDGRHNPAALGAVAATIRAALIEQHEVAPAAVQLVAAGSLPRTTSGKLERYACRERFLLGGFPVLHQMRHDEEDGAQPAARRAPATALEREVAAICCSVLGIREIGLDDDFFALGGHSLLALQLVDRLSVQVGAEVPLRALVEHSTLEAMCRYVETASKAESSSPPAVSTRSDPFEPFPLTDVQEAYLFGRSPTFELGGVAAQGTAEFAVRKLAVERFRGAIDKLVERHEMLRAVVRPDGRQQLLETIPSYPLETPDFSALAPDAAEQALAGIRDRLAHTIAPADSWPLFDIVACRLDAEHWRVLVRFDLLVADLFSIRLLWRELGQLYADPDATLPALPVSFRDCVRSEREGSRADREQSLQFWRRHVPELPPPPELPYARPFRNIAAPRFRRRTTRLGAAEWTCLRERAAQARVTPAAVLLAAFSEVVVTWSRHDRFTLMLTFFNRPRLEGIERVVGDFTSLLLLGVERERGDFHSAVRRVHRDLWEALDHRHGGGMPALRELARQQGRTTQALFPIVFTSAIGQEAAESTAPWSWLGEMVDSGSSTPQVALDHQVQEEGDRLLLTWDTVDDLFPPGLVDDMFDAYRRLLDWLSAASSRWDAPMPHLVPARHLEAAADANRTERPLAPATLDGLFLRQAALRPNHPAVIASDGAALTYGDLERRSRAVAGWIREQRLEPGELVAVMMDKGWQQVVATLGVLRAGAAYLPVDPALPEERRQFLLECGRARIVLTNESTDQQIKWPDGVIRGVVDDWEAPPGDTGQADDDWTRLAYVIFTSGSTGQPKGVMIDHRGAVNTIVDLNDRFAIGPADRVFGISGLNFDLSVYDIFGTLAAGATLVLPRPGTERDPDHWLDLIGRHGVTLWNSVPALFEMLCEHAAGTRTAIPNSMRLVWMSGDWIPVTLPDRARSLQPGLEMVSMGGATEGSIWSILHPIGELDPNARSIPYGRALTNQRMHVFDADLRERAHWVAGDIYIGGTGVALGYWRDPEKTSRQFLLHPVTNERLYRTGDLGRWLPDGNIEFLGRDDGQVKLGGVRIELGEVEAALAGRADIRQCAVVARHLDGRPSNDASAASTRQLVAFIVPAEGHAPADDVREWLAQKIPCAMIPRRFIAVDALPLSANGKVDLARLVVPPIAERTREQSLTEQESTIRALWAEALGCDAATIGASDNFFDIGGTSVALVRLAAALSDTVGRSIPVLSLFEHPTIAEMGQLVYAQTPAAPQRDAAATRAALRKRQLAARRAGTRTLPQQQ